MPVYTEGELEDFGFAALGKNVRLSRKASLHNPAKIAIGDNSRIDDFCVLSAGEGGIHIGRHVHIAVYVALIGKGKITIEDFVGLSSRVAVYSSNDDYSGEWLTGPTLSPAFTNISSAPVRVGRHVVVGAGSVILPGVSLEEGAIVGALSLVNKDCESFGMYAGVPAKYLKARSRRLLELEAALAGRQDPASGEDG